MSFIFLDCKSQDINKIVSSIEGINREEIVDKLIKYNRSFEASIYFTLNIKTTTYQGKFVVRYSDFYDFFCLKNNSLNNKDSSCYELIRELLIKRDTLFLTDDDLNSKPSLFNKVNSEIMNDQKYHNKEYILEQFFNKNGDMYSINKETLIDIISILDQWNLFICDGETESGFGYSLYDYASTLGYELFFSSMLDESFRKFLSHFDNQHDLKILTQSYLLHPFNIKGFSMNNKRDDIKLNQKYIELCDILIERDLLTFVFTVQSYKKGLSRISLISTTYYTGSYTYQYNPIDRKYYFIKEEFEHIEQLK